MSETEPSQTAPAEYSDEFIRALFTEDMEILGIERFDLSRLKLDVMVADPERYMAICWQVRLPEAEAIVDRELAKRREKDERDALASAQSLGRAADS